MLINASIHSYFERFDRCRPHWSTRSPGMNGLKCLLSDFSVVTVQSEMNVLPNYFISQRKIEMGEEENQ